MKRKIFSTLFALVLLLTLGLVTAVPTGATPTPADVSFETWASGGGSDNWSYTPAGFSGSYCVELSGPMIVKVAYGATLQTFADITQIDVDGFTVWDIKWTIYDTTALNLHAKIYLDTTLDGSADTVLTGGFGAVDGGSRAVDGWHDAYMRTGTAWQIEGYDGVDYTNNPTVGGVAYTTSSSSGPTLSTLLADGTAGATWSAATVVHLAYGYSSGTEAYIDDITVDGVVYEVEPPLPPLDEEDYYKVGDVATVTIYDLASNTNSAVRETVLVTANSTIPAHSIALGLLETGVDTAVFTETFTLVGTTPGTAELLVSHSSNITVTYDSVLMDWAVVDNVAPVITNLAPAASANISDATQTISADYSDADSGTNNSTTVMTLDGLAVTANVTTTSEVIYYPSVNLTDGSHLVTVGISDVAGNPAVTASWSFTVDTVDPVITGQVATPGTVKPDIVNTIVFTATVTDGAEGSGINTVTIDLSDSAIGGSDSKAMLDDGNAPDATAGDGIYTANFTGTITTEATYTLTVTATDYVGKSDSANITFIVAEDTTDPVITSPAITYLYGLTSAMPGASVTISANVTDNVGVTSVEATSTALTGTVTLLDGGVLPDMTAGDHIYTGTGTVAGVASGNYTVTITAKDVKLNAATDVSQTLTVNPAVGGYKIPLAEGWNLISLPLIPDDADITAVISVDTLASANVSSVGIVRGYDPATGDFPRYVPATGSGDLTEMEDGCGYWVFMETADNLTITGRQWPVPPAVPPTYDVVVGWNLIGFKSMTSDNDTSYLANIAGIYPVVWSYDAVAGAYFNVKGEALGMEVGHGFWLWVTEVGTIVPPQ